MSTHRPTAPDWSALLFRHLSACGALQECLGAEVASPARVEKDPQGRLYLAAEVCQLRAPSKAELSAKLTEQGFWPVIGLHIPKA